MLPETKKQDYCTWKNDRYLEFIQKLKEEEILPGVKQFILDARSAGYRIALGSASKNTALILEKLHITELFDAVIDGTKVSKAKPDPEVFLQGAEEIAIPPAQCVVFEDAEAGIQAAHNAGMKAVGIGSPERLPEAEFHMPGFAGITPRELIQKLEA